MAEKDNKSTISTDDLQGLIRALIKEQGDAQLEQIKELKKPYISDEEKEAIAQRKKSFAESELQAQKYKEWKQNACSHLRPEDKKSLFWRIKNVFPKGAITLTCCRCGKILQNYYEDKIIPNKDFDYWITQPNGLFQG
jgi:hypothetical protein